MNGVVLNRDLLSLVFGQLGNESRGVLTRVCKLWREVVLNRVPKWHPAVFREGIMMFKAIESGDLAFYTLFSTDQRWDISRAEDADRRCVVQVAVLFERLDVLKAIWRDPNFDNMSIYAYALDVGIGSGNVELVSWLLEEPRLNTETLDDGWNIPRGHFDFALAVKDLEKCKQMVLLVLKHPRLCNRDSWQDLIGRCLERRRVDVLKWVLELDDGFALKDANIVQYAVRNCFHLEDVKSAKVLVECGVNPTEGDFALVRLAKIMQDKELTDALTQRLSGEELEKAKEIWGLK